MSRGACDVRRRQETPEAGAHAVGEHFFLTEIAPPRGHPAQSLAEPFVRCVAFADGEFGALFEINEKGHCDAGAVRPDDGWPPVAVAEEVARPAQKAISSTSAATSRNACAISAISMASSGLWLPLSLRMKTMALGTP